jgi:hypothetical protein
MAKGQATSVSDLERAEHLAYADNKGVKRVSIFNDGTQVNSATEEKQDDIIDAINRLITAVNNQNNEISYHLNEVYKNGTDTYFCKESKDGDWYIMKIDEYSVFSSATVTNNPTVTSYADARANVLTLTYETYDQAFN